MLRAHLRKASSTFSPVKALVSKNISSGWRTQWGEHCQNQPSEQFGHLLSGLLSVSFMRVLKSKQHHQQESTYGLCPSLQHSCAQYIRACKWAAHKNPAVRQRSALSAVAHICLDNYEYKKISLDTWQTGARSKWKLMSHCEAQMDKEIILSDPSYKSGMHEE